MHTKLIALSALLLPIAPELSTEYAEGPTLRIETETSFSMETVESVMEIDGEPMPDRGFGGRSSEEQRSFVTLDTVLAAEDGAPTKVRRVFEAIESSGVVAFGENEREIEHEKPLSGVTLEISDEEVLVVEGDEPDDEATLEGHSMTLALDAFLPAEGVEVGDTWKLDGEALLSAFSMDIEGALFVRPQREGREGRGEDGEGRRGRRGGGRRGGGSPSQLFAAGDWTAEATLESMDEEHESGTCAKIKLELSCAGEMPEPERGGGGRGPRDRSLSVSTTTNRVALENSFEVKLEGELYFNLKQRRPVLLEVEGTLTSDRTMERSTERGDFFMYTAQEGSFSLTVRVSQVEKSAGDEE